MTTTQPTISYETFCALIGEIQAKKAASRKLLGIALAENACALEALATAIAREALEAERELEELI